MTSSFKTIIGGGRSKIVVALAALGLLGAAPTVEDWKDPQRALTRSSTPLNLAESFLDCQERDVVAADRAVRDAAGKTEIVNRLRCLEEFYAGNFAGALQSLELVEKNDAWVQSRRRFIEDLMAVQSQFKETRGERFVLRMRADDAFLGATALPALETAYGRVADFFGSTPTATAVLEIYPDLDGYALAATVSRSSVFESGNVSAVRYNRILVLSPGATAMGYRWIDALVREYARWNVLRVSGGLCPGWLREGVARYLESSYRRPDGFRHTPHARAVLTRAFLADAAEGGLVPFVQMEGGLESLNSPARAELAGVESADAVDFIVQEFGAEKMRDLLAAFRRVPRARAFIDVLGIGEDELEKAWRESLTELTAVPTDTPRGPIGPVFQAGPLDEALLVSAESQPSIRAGDRLLKQGQANAAAAQYKKAVDLEPDNGVALTRLARAYLAANRGPAVEELLKRAAEMNPDYAAPRVLLGDVYFEDGRYEEGQAVLQDALEIQPFQAKIHETMGLIAIDVGNFAAARQSLKLAQRFDPGNKTVQNALNSMPKNR